MKVHRIRSGHDISPEAEENVRGRLLQKVPAVIQTPQTNKPRAPRVDRPAL
jgi:hypothetical protein